MPAIGRKMGRDPRTVKKYADQEDFIQKENQNTKTISGNGSS